MLIANGDIDQINEVVASGEVAEVREALASAAIGRSLKSGTIVQVKYCLDHYDKGEDLLRERYYQLLDSGRREILAHTRSLLAGDRKPLSCPDRIRNYRACFRWNYGVPGLEPEAAAWSFALDDVYEVYRGGGRAARRSVLRRAVSNGVVGHPLIGAWFATEMTRYARDTSASSLLTERATDSEAAFLRSGFSALSDNSVACDSFLSALWDLFVASHRFLSTAADVDSYLEFLQDDELLIAWRTRLVESRMIASLRSEAACQNCPNLRLLLQFTLMSLAPTPLLSDLEWQEIQSRNGPIYNALVGNPKAKRFWETRMASWDEKRSKRWRNDLRTGQGTFTWPSGTRYKGEWLNYRVHGQGTLITSDGSMYQGQFENGEIHGTGTFTWPDGTYYTGTWLDGKRNGWGVYTRSKDEQYSQEWSNGKLVADKRITVATEKARSSSSDSSGFCSQNPGTCVLGVGAGLLLVKWFLEGGNKGSAPAKVSTPESRHRAQCSSLQNSCEAQCEGMNNKNSGFFRSSDRAECRSRCYGAYMDCMESW